MRRVVIAAALCLVACAEQRSNVGAKCSRNSQCAAPLVCALQHCRTECNTSRDCPVGSSCVRGEDSFGVCLLQSEASCAADSECPSELVCRFDRCTQECSAGCVPGTECREGACFDPALDMCDGDADCMEGVCVSGRCRPECRSDRDCRFGNRCFSGRCRSASFDGGIDVPGIDGALDGGADPFCPPQQVDVVDVCIAFEHACAVLADGRVVCWGTNSSGQLGNSRVPRVDVFGATLVEGVTDAVRVECASFGGCVQHSGGGLSCWGFNSMGQTGTGLVDVTVPAPRAVPGLTDVVDFELRSLGGCAIQGTQVLCWGSNTIGELGRPAGAPALAPVVASDLPPARSVSVGRTATSQYGVVVSTSGELVRFGDNPFPGVDLTLPFSDAAEVAADQRHVCVRRAGGEVHCAGDNTFGQLGDSAAPGSAFALVPGLSGVTSIRARSNSTCAVSATGASCWGENTGGGLGVGNRDNQLSPAPVSLGGVAPSVLEGRSEFGCGVFGTAAYCFGRFDGDRGRRGLGVGAVDTDLPTLPVKCLP